ncbi:MAG: hotdog fold domain-containing protein [Parvularculales bacterium]
MSDGNISLAEDAPDGFERVTWHGREGFSDIMGPFYQKEGGIRGFRVATRHSNGRRDCHGGMLMAFADMAFGHIIGERYGRYWITVRLLTDFISPAKPGDWVQGKGEITSIHDDFVTVQGRLWCEERTIMTGTGVFKMLGRRTTND